MHHCCQVRVECNNINRGVHTFQMSVSTPLQTLVHYNFSVSFIVAIVVGLAMTRFC